MSEPAVSLMLAELMSIVADPQASDDMRRKAVSHAYELGKIEGHFDGVVHAASQIGKPRAVSP